MLPPDVKISRLEGTKFDSGGAYSAPPDLLAAFRVLLLRGGEREGRGRGE